MKILITMILLIMPIYSYGDDASDFQMLKNRYSKGETLSPEEMWNFLQLKGRLEQYSY